MVGVESTREAGQVSTAAPPGQTLGIGVGIQIVRTSVCATAMSDRQNWKEAGLPSTQLEPISTDLLSISPSYAMLARINRSRSLDAPIHKNRESLVQKERRP